MRLAFNLGKFLTPGTKIKLFADDSLLYREINTENDTKILQKDLNQLQEWESTWKMEFHPNKCNLLRITNKTKKIAGNYFIHNTLVQETESAKYLGIVIDNKLSWKHHYDYLNKKANNTLAFLRRHIHDCPTHIKNECYKTIVRPTLEYGSAIWDPHHQKDKDRLEKIQKRAARFSTKNFNMEKGNTKLNMKKLNLKPLEERRAANRLTLFFKAKHKMIEIPIDHI